MERDYTTHSIKELFLTISHQFTSHDSEQLLSYLDGMNFTLLTHEDMCYIYSILAFIEANVIGDPIIYIKIQTLRLKLVQVIIEESNTEQPKDSSIKQVLDAESNNASQNGIFFKNEFGYIKNHYESSGGFVLPEEGKTGRLKIRDYNDSGKLFSAIVEIDSHGNSVSVEEEPELVEQEELDFNSLYTKLASEVLQFKE